MDDVYQDAFMDESSGGAYLGVYEGNWTLDGMGAGTGVATVTKDSIIFDSLPQKAIVKCCLGNDAENVTCNPVMYSVRYFINGSSSDTRYFTLESKPYEYTVSEDGWEASVIVEMSSLYSDLPNAIYNKGMMVMMLKIKSIQAKAKDDKVVVSNYEPATVLMFNPVRRIK